VSAHYFDTIQGDHAVRVTLGYDRPLDYFHLTIERTSDFVTDEDQFVYCNLEDPELPCGQCEDLEYYRIKLQELGITVPESIFRETELDSINRVGNREIRHQQDGTTELA
jgi:hypothetical protein